MSRENVEVVRRAIEAAIRKPKPDFATVNALFHPDHELVSLVQFRQGGRLRGARGFREWLTDVAEAFESWEGRIEQAKAVDGTRVLLIAALTVQGKGSGIAYEQRMGLVMTVEDGKVTRTETYLSAAEAVEALGVSE
jgi:ketosteroid isomerase-like protein